MSKKEKYDLDNSLGMLVDWASQFMSLQLNRKFTVSGLEATVEQWKILITLWYKDGFTQQQIATRIKKNKVSVVKLIDGLERRDLVKRHPDPEDRRNNKIFLTSKGKEIQKELIMLAKRNLKQAEAGIDIREMEICKKVLKKVIINMKEITDE